MNEQLQTVNNPFGVTRTETPGALAETDSQRAIQEVQASMVIAKRFPRDERAAMDRILNACTRPGLAEKAIYSYAKGGTAIDGPSIRLAEALAQNWGNMQFGVRELDQRNGESSVEAFAWDVETNTRQVKVFQVPHLRYTRRGTTKLEDPREIYEHVANQGARRLRACILGLIPGDVVETAVQQCAVTMATHEEITTERIKAMTDAFGEFGVAKEQIEARIQRRMDAITPALMANLRKIYNSLKDGMSEPGEWFPITVTAEKVPTGKSRSDELADKLKAEAQASKPTEPAPKTKPKAKPVSKPVEKAEAVTEPETAADEPSKTITAGDLAKALDAPPNIVLDFLQTGVAGFEHLKNLALPAEKKGLFDVPPVQRQWIIDNADVVKQAMKEWGEAEAENGEG